MINGIDVSQYQGLIDFNTLKDHVDFVWIRANFGTPNNSSVLNIDSMYERNKTLVRQVGIPHGFYHFAYPQYNSPQSEALYFASIVDIKQNELLALDFEEPVSDPVNWVLTFLQTLSNSFNGYKPLVYMNLNLSNSYDWSPVIDAGFGAWIAAYDGSTAMPVTKWSVVAFKQWTDSATIPGVNGQVDADVFYGDLTQLNKYGYQPPVVTRSVSDPVVSDTTSSPVETITPTTSAPTTDTSKVEPVSNVAQSSGSNLTTKTTISKDQNQINIPTTPDETTTKSTVEDTPNQHNIHINNTNTHLIHFSWISSWWSDFIAFLKKVFSI